METVTDVTFGKTLTYGYDANGNRASLTEGGTTFGYVYDGQNRLKRADAFGGSLFLEYDAAGRRTALSRPNGIRTAYVYDDAGQLLSLTHAKGPSVVLGFSYGYDAHGMRTSKTRETGFREAYGYDAADRLVRVDYGTSRRVEYGLDVLGNRVLEDTTTLPSTGLQRNSATFNAFNQLTSSGGPGTAFPPTTNAWDLNGNLLSETRSPSGGPLELTTYGWDRDNRLRGVTPPIGTPTTYRYEANGLRTERVDATGTTRYLLDGNSVVEELDASSASTISYFNNPRQIDEVLAYQRSSGAEFPLTDALGSLYASTDDLGNVVHRYDFDVYGKRTDLGGSDPAVDIGYTGRWHDSNGLIEHRNRFRNPSTGGWLSGDRLGQMGGSNRYLYANANSTFRVDPMGLLALALYGSPNFPGNDTDPDPFVAVTRSGQRVRWSLNEFNRFEYRDAVKAFAAKLLGLGGAGDVLAVPFMSAGDVSWALDRKRFFDAVVYLGHATKTGRFALDLTTNFSIDATDMSAVLSSNLKEQGRADLVACFMSQSGAAQSVKAQLNTISLTSEWSLNSYLSDDSDKIDLEIKVEDAPPYKPYEVNFLSPYIKRKPW